jgi:hypothetical protein
MTMSRVALLAAAAALLASTSAAAAVLVVRSSGPSATAYPPGKALPDTHMMKLKASDVVVLLDSRGTRTLQGPGSFSVAANAGPAVGAIRSAGTNARRVRLGAVRGANTRSVWQADLDQSGNVCIANPADLGLYRGDSSGEATVTLTDPATGKKADVHFAAGQAISSWPAALPATSGATIGVTGLGSATTLTLKVLSPVPSGLEGMAQSLIRANCQAQLDVLIDTFSARSEG